MLQKGFTLIELLVVIGVIGALAAVILLAINPVEQISRAEDAGRISTVSQLGRSMQAYLTSQGGQTYPPGNAVGVESQQGEWQTTLQTAGEVNQVLTAPANARGVCANYQQNGYCYTGAGATALIWTLVESTAQTSKGGGNCAASPSTNYAAAIWDSSRGRSGIGCLGTDPGFVPGPGIALF